MKDLLFYAAVYGAAASIALLHVGAPLRFFFTVLDHKLFPSMVDSPAKGGPLKILIHCPSCLSFWLSIPVSLLLYSPAAHHWGAPLIPRLIVDSLSSVGIIFCVHVVLTKLGQYEL